ncbi:MAG: glycoside hydrolase family 15 protein, partial [Bacteroidales bacterium]|nr:glycoside hydrolase family 15 protein [Bacteroidales bacterium]
MKDLNYQPIDNYGIIGNMRSAAMVGLNGSIDWFCFPHFDSPSIFAKILDHRKGGYFSICPTTDYKTKQFYWPDTNVLITRFLTDKGIVEVSDFMPVGSQIEDEYDYRIIRRVKGINGSLNILMECFPAFNYGRDSHVLNVSEQGATFIAGEMAMDLESTIPLKKSGDRVTVEFTVGHEDSVVFILHKSHERIEGNVNILVRQVDEDLHDTILYWRNWISKSHYRGRWREMVHRSALILKLLTFEPTGAIVAAITCSLPEGIGGERNWDYRYTWIRDAAFTVYAFMRLGFTQEASAFMSWVRDRLSECSAEEPLQIMYGIDGRHELKEEVLDHLEGYMKSKPVRIGNGAYNQLQLDIYGELLDSVYLFNKYGIPIGYRGWKEVTKIVNWVVENWRLKDEGIWEVRSGKQDFVYSKLMCWVALDRSIRMAETMGFDAPLEEWKRTGAAIRRAILERGFSETLNSFVQALDSEVLDATSLLIPVLGFLPPDDPRVRGTIEATLDHLTVDGLVYRYTGDDGLPGKEGAFVLCTFWLVDAL